MCRKGMSILRESSSTLADECSDHLPSRRGHNEETAALNAASTNALSSELSIV